LTGATMALHQPDVAPLAMAVTAPPLH
jgi:hypothetical protein